MDTNILIIILSALGEALVHRGHNVTLCTTEREGSDLPKQLAKKTGMNFLSAGPDPLPTVKDYLEHFAAQRDVWNGHIFNGALFTSIWYIPGCASRIAKKLTSNPLYAAAWDIIIADDMLSSPFACLSMKWGVPFIDLRTSTDYVNLPPWPFPAFVSGYTDDLSFLQRSVTTAANAALKLPVWIRKTLSIRSMDFDCSEHYDQVYYTSEGHTPRIVTSAIGFEYPRSLLPTIHYVGPLVSMTTEPLSAGLMSWLSSKPEQSVVFISMGSAARLNNELGAAIVNGILSTNYFAIWSLRQSNQHILEGLNLQEEVFYISDWLPQQTVFKSKSIAMAMLHGGMGGINEALSNAIPIIVIPYVNDQYGCAARVQHAGAGLQLDGNSFTAEDIRNAVETVALPEYKKAAEKLQRIFVEAGGSEKAAELVEFYADVGYEHLIPAYAKYKWSWVQYYNADICVLIAAVLLITIVTLYWVTSLLHGRYLKHVVYSELVSCGV